MAVQSIQYQAIAGNSSEQQQLGSSSIAQVMVSEVELSASKVHLSASKSGFERVAQWFQTCLKKWS